MISIDWRRRAFSDIVGCAAGNAIAQPITTFSTTTILAVCSNDPNEAALALGIVVNAIGSVVQSVDKDFIALRTAFIRAVPDPRLISLRADARDLADFYFNTWRHFGAHTRWKFPGMVACDGQGVAPNAVRRAQADWYIGAALVLPAKEGSEKFEVLITLDVEAMNVLLDDSSWKTWVKEVLE
ncbi:hypothetical protein GQ53DRAFT_822446 [Thozetella sp. PMI_491]|nr:hypothetical protein GQ53DRAFT_822446 [Thozetella sp. PMI_491]